ncbi:hypothetical protein GOP47_0003075 [Adiantum capillus-veneris]|uniref:Disease resistance R13L4/SHOC-2-like LRR domain-containing protein n=1 Tax=Adiantum capillus-veneris TaxID=13818 RepID=A0A9D4ZRX0_ADICA|nr:hypothetical protein GOP47_0003075 [Adiantum capillus-veneris]
MDKLLKVARASGSLNLSNRSLDDVPPQVYNLLDAASTDEKWWEVVELQKLLLAHNNIKVLANELGNLQSLTVLNVSHNQIASLPSSIGRLTLLKSLDVSGNTLSSLPAEIGAASALVRLNCSHNKLSSLPSSLGCCVELAELKAANNCLQALPIELQHCTRMLVLDVENNKLKEIPHGLLSSLVNLTEINAAKCMISELPESIGCLSHLIRLDLHQNAISSLPSAIEGCIILAELSLGGNRLSSVPVELKALTALGTLDLQTNQISEIPVEVCSLRLSVLDLSNNNLAGLPAELGTMTTLRKLLLSGNPLRTLRSSLVMGPTPALLKHLRGRLPTNEDAKLTPASSGNVFGGGRDDQVSFAARQASASKNFVLCKMDLESIPAVVFEKESVLSLDLSHNKIQKLPMELSACSSLEVLLLEGNRIDEWPVSVFPGLPNLHRLVVAGNPIKEIPSNGFTCLNQLKSLDLSNIPARLPVPPALSGMPGLQELHLRRLRLRDFPSEVLELSQLRILDLSQNSLTVVPKEISALVFLEELDLSDNSIMSLPAELGLLESNLHVLKLDGNPLRSVRRTILDRGTKADLEVLPCKVPLVEIVII